MPNAECLFMVTSHPLTHLFPSPGRPENAGATSMMLHRMMQWVARTASRSGHLAMSDGATAREKIA